MAIKQRRWANESPEQTAARSFICGVDGKFHAPVLRRSPVSGGAAQFHIKLARAMHQPLWMVLLMTAVLAVAGCERAPSKNRVAGIYSGTLNGSSESLVLREDGTYTQEVSLPSGQKVTGTGAWSLNYKKVEFDRYMLYYEPMTNGIIVEPKEIFGFSYTWGADMLIKDWGNGFYTLKHR
jgi:hypothetical protein